MATVRDFDKMQGSVIVLAGVWWTGMRQSAKVQILVVKMAKPIQARILASKTVRAAPTGSMTTSYSSSIPTEAATEVDKRQGMGRVIHKCRISPTGI